MCLNNRSSATPHGYQFDKAKVAKLFDINLESIVEIDIVENKLVALFRQVSPFRSKEIEVIDISVDIGGMDPSRYLVS